MRFSSCPMAWAVLVAAILFPFPADAGEATVDWLLPDGTPAVRTTITVPGGEVTREHVDAMRITVLQGTLAAGFAYEKAPRPRGKAGVSDGADATGLALRPDPSTVPAVRRHGLRGDEDAEIDWAGARVFVEPLAVEQCAITRYEFYGMVKKNNYVEYDFVELMSLNAGLGRSKKKGDVDLYVYDWAGNLACYSTRRGKYIDDCGAISMDCTNTAAAVVVKGVKKKTKYGLVVYMTTAY